MTELAPAARRVLEAGAALGLDLDIRIMPGSTRTANDAASACGCVVDQIVKSLLFRGDESGRPFLLLVCGGKRVDESVVATRLGEAIRRPDAAFVRDVTGFAIGGVPPLGHKSPIAVFMDPDLLAFDRVFAAAGTPNAIFAIAPGRLLQATAATVLAMV